MSAPRQRPTLVKSSNHWLAGVCGGIAEFLGWSPGAVRVLWVTGIALTAIIPGVIIYTILALAMPPPRAGGDSFDLDRFRVQ